MKLYECNNCDGDGGCLVWEEDLDPEPSFHWYKCEKCGGTGKSEAHWNKVAQQQRDAEQELKEAMGEIE